MYEISRGSIFLTIRSRDLVDGSENGNNNKGRFVLFEPIEAGIDEVLSVSLTGATFPNSWFNLSSTTKNNLFTFIEGGTTYNTLIPDGSYNILELCSTIKSIMESVNGGAIDYTFTYDEITNRVKIVSSSSTITTLKFSLDNSPRRMLGFTNDDINLNSFTALFSNRAVDITDTLNSIYIRLPNLSNQKVIESSTGKYSNIIAHIPVELSRNSIFTYEPTSPFSMELTQRQINSIDINITYQDENINVDFNRGDWEINLMIDFHLKPKRKYSNIKIHKELVNKYDAYKKKETENVKLLDELKNLRKIITERN